MNLVKLWWRHHQENEIEAQFNGTARRNALVVNNDVDDDQDVDVNDAEDVPKNPENGNVKGEEKIENRTSKQSSVTNVNEVSRLSVKVSSIKCVIYSFFILILLKIFFEGFIS